MPARPEGIDATDDRTAVDGRPNEGTTRIDRVEERLQAGVRRATAGVLRIRRRTVAEPQTVDVAVRHDELRIERHPVERPLGPSERIVTEDGDTTVVLVVEERLEVRRVPWVVEEVRVRRDLVTAHRPITGTVRRQQIDIELEGDVELNNAER